MRTSETLFEVERIGDVVVVTLTKDLGEFTYERLAGEANKLLESFEDRSAPKNVVIDFGKSNYVGSSALGFLLKLWKAIRQRDGRMALCNLSALEQEILRLTMLWILCGQSLPLAKQPSSCWRSRPQPRTCN